MPTTVLFVCTGNICRSPYAERYARLLVERAGAADWQLGSAGTSAVVGAPVETSMAADLARHGADPEGFAARQLTPALLTDADLVVTMERYHRSYVVDDHPLLARRTLTLRQLQRAVAAQPPGLTGRRLLDAVTGQVVAPRPGDSIADPYGRGSAAMQSAAAAIREVLDATVPRLLD
ncbi:arsenate reductase/protein-tyrosine-phosphatase family protein [Luteipulveratus halotolerans]|uniref:arsenate reductase/protein-tyrosine-phosphatase family protein n=1 Tax=Luteipulveratus halotolerans TaxID=1631356 RepID=UPI000681957A|nr:low molecular weight phosphatase family protein [Luteipulveratus halotolerans]